MISIGKKYRPKGLWCYKTTHIIPVSIEGTLVCYVNADGTGIEKAMTIERFMSDYELSV